MPGRKKWEIYVPKRESGRRGKKAGELASLSGCIKKVNFWQALNIYIACTYSTSPRVILTTNDANDFVNAKSHTREKPLLAGYILS